MKDSEELKLGLEVFGNLETPSTPQTSLIPALEDVPTDNAPDDSTTLVWEAIQQLRQGDGPQANQPYVQHTQGLAHPPPSSGSATSPLVRNTVENSATNAVIRPEINAVNQ